MGIGLALRFSLPGREAQLDPGVTQLVSGRMVSSESTDPVLVDGLHVPYYHVNSRIFEVFPEHLQNRNYRE